MAWLIENEKFSSFTFIQGGFFLRANRNLDSLDVQLYRLEIAGIPLEEKEVRQEVKSGEHDILQAMNIFESIEPVSNVQLAPPGSEIQ